MYDGHVVALCIAPFYAKANHQRGCLSAAACIVQEDSSDIEHRARKADAGQEAQQEPQTTYQATIAIQKRVRARCFCSR